MPLSGSEDSPVPVARPMVYDSQKKNLLWIYTVKEQVYFLSMSGMGGLTEMLERIQNSKESRG
jgi:hypothetical protein